MESAFINVHFPYKRATSMLSGFFKKKLPDDDVYDD